MWLVGEEDFSLAEELCEAVVERDSGDQIEGECDCKCSGQVVGGVGFRQCHSNCGRSGDV